MGRLLERDDSILVVVDAQPGFFGSSVDSADVVARIGWLVRVAVALDVPVVVTEEQPDHNGRTDPRIADALPPGTDVLIKPVFGLADVPEILHAVESTGR